MGCACGWSWPEVFLRGWQADLGAVRPGLAAVPIAPARRAYTVGLGGAVSLAPIAAPVSRELLQRQLWTCDPDHSHVTRRCRSRAGSWTAVHSLEKPTNGAWGIRCNSLTKQTLPADEYFDYAGYFDHTGYLHLDQSDLFDFAEPPITTHQRHGTIHRCRGDSRVRDLEPVEPR